MAPSPSIHAVMIDPDAPSPGQPQARSWLHWLVVNVPVQRVTSSHDSMRGTGSSSLQCDAERGETVMPYAPPSPPLGPPHRYLLLVAQQTGASVDGGNIAMGGMNAAVPPQGLTPISGGRQRTLSTGRLDRFAPSQLATSLAEQGRGGWDAPSFLTQHGCRIVGLNWFNVSA